MSTVKVLQLDAWMLKASHDFFAGMLEDTLASYTQIKPIMGRPGRYWCRAVHGQPWFELEDGRAFIEKSDSMFRFELEMMEAARLNHRQVAALRELKAQGLATKQQKRLLYMCECADQSRRTERNARLFLGSARQEARDQR